MVSRRQKSSRTRRGGSSARRRAKSASAATAQAVRPGQVGGRYKPLSDADIERIYQTALDVLEKAVRRGELGWQSRYDVLLRTLADEPRFIALYEQVDNEIDALRAELGMPPAEI